MENLVIGDVLSIDNQYVIIEIDAAQTSTLREFYETLARELYFPDYFGFNLDSFDEMINDLSWIEDKDLALYFKNSESFLAKERNENKILTLLDLLDATCEDWKWHEGDEDLPKKNLKIVFQNSERIQTLLNKLQ
jgi:RNAse (barnase) inhibitor barstar